MDGAVTSYVQVKVVNGVIYPVAEEPEEDSDPETEPNPEEEG